jgi:hypothetical protein
MIDTLLTNVLYIVIALDICGAIALIVLGAKRHKARSETTSHLLPAQLAPQPFWKSLFPFSSPRITHVPAKEMKRLHTVLYSFEEDLY